MRLEAFQTGEGVQEVHEVRYEVELEQTRMKMTLGVRVMGD